MNLQTDPIELHTKRLILRTLEPSEENARLCVEYWQRNSEHFNAWSTRMEESFFTIEVQIAKLQREKNLRAQDNTYRFWMFEQSDPNYIIGDAALSNIVRGAFLSCHLGYKTDHARLNKGFMTEALTAIRHFAFDSLRLHRIEANIMPRNHRSRRVIEKLGFINEGISQRYLKINDVWEDHLHFVSLNPDPSI
jgi:ribosomal-protein-alanine N-acetyltransferase